MICALALCLIGATVVDGDTIKHEGRNYRLWGIDAPERGDPYGQASGGVLRCDLPDGRDVACEMVRLGAAVDWPKYSKGKYRGCE